MSRKKPKTPSECLQHNLALGPKGTRCVLARSRKKQKGVTFLCWFSARGPRK
jgi:hypothetical protein